MSALEILGIIEILSLACCGVLILIALKTAKDHRE